MGADILITGATGNTGSEIARRLAARVIPFVAMARGEDSRKRLAELGISSVHGDFDDPSSLRTALAGISRVYLVSTPDETLIRRETAIIDAAARAGVRHIVKCSAYLSSPSSPSPNLRAHAQIEAHLAASGAALTVLRPHGFMQTFTLFSWDLIQRAGVISAPHGDGAMALVDVRDVAEVATLALTQTGHEGKTYDITGPDALTMWDMAETLERVLGRPVSYVEGDERSMGRVMTALGVPDAPREHVMVIARLTREGKLGAVHTTLQDLGVTPTSYETFVRDLVAGRTGGGSSFRPPETLRARLLSSLAPRMMALRMAFGRPRRPVRERRDGNGS